MEGGISILMIILTVVYAVVGLIIYHKLFSVIYFGLGNGCLKEIAVALFIGMALAALTMAFWYISIPVIALVLFAIFKKK